MLASKLLAKQVNVVTTLYKDAKGLASKPFEVLSNPIIDSRWYSGNSGYYDFNKSLREGFLLGHCVGKLNSDFYIGSQNPHIIFLFFRII